jgi:hypothetical protein
MMFGVVIFDTAFSQSFPRTLPKSVSLFRDIVPIEVLLRGFSHAYIAGGAVCFVACLLSFAGREGER